jgi:hypothetical protein
LIVVKFRELGKVFRRATPSLFGKIGAYVEPAAKSLKELAEDSDSMKNLKERNAKTVSDDEMAMAELKHLFAELNVSLEFKEPTSEDSTAKNTSVIGSEATKMSPRAQKLAELLKEEIELERKRSQLMAEIEAEKAGK